MDSRIALGVQPLQIPDQAAGYQRALTMAALLGQNDLQKIQVAHATRENTKQAALDDLARNSTTMDEFLKGYSKLDPLGAQNAAINMRKLTLETQKTQGEVSEQGRKSGAASANAIINASPQDRPTVYAQLRQQEIANGNQDAAKSPEQWNDSMLPLIIAHQQQGLAPKDAMERSDYTGTVQPQPAQPTTMAAYNAPTPVTPQDVTDPQSGAQVRPMASQQPPVASAPVVEDAGKGLSISPDDYRKEAARLRGQGNKVAMEQAKEFMAEADRLEGRSLEKQKMEQDKYAPVSGAPGVSFNKKTGVYDLNGTPISAAEVQKIANEQARSGATVVTQNSGPRAFYSDYGKNMADQLGKEQSGAQKAADTITTINKMRGELDAGMYTGGFAERRLGVVNMLNGLGIPVDEKKLANTQAFKSFVGSQLLQHAKDLGTNPSNADAIRIDKIIGNIENDPNALQKIMDFNEEMGRRAVDRFNKHYQEVKKDPNAQFGFDMSVQQPEKYKGRDIQVRANKSAVQSSQPPMTNDKGWALHLDAQGRQAYVSPDGTQFEEVR